MPLFTPAFEKIEVLKEGATSVYGSDAVAGVVNFLTYKNLFFFYFFGVVFLAVLLFVVFFFTVAVLVVLASLLVFLDLFALGGSLAFASKIIERLLHSIHSSSACR